MVDRDRRLAQGSLCVQTNSETHLGSYPVDTGGPVPMIKRGRGVTLTTYPI
jgi:hypothetical protein